ncbi:hypothetical protein DUNSADRAFT_12210 [Dunaliella salina]|uniref:Encoded protein n=1 Tax=Dunaliella salina TaxID=3046 RepID=A0ABQ7GBR2_DUNSA|nr:hypothetical protein DUNSADRAFT_12210 [Dunaliella salina]|eukprot:KAF5832030.1 hypothetical protein DUNSADRAFT_12210 [Dunaliella salina]
MFITLHVCGLKHGMAIRFLHLPAVFDGRPLLGSAALGKDEGPKEVAPSDTITSDSFVVTDAGSWDFMQLKLASQIKGLYERDLWWCSGPEAALQHLTRG